MQRSLLSIWIFLIALSGPAWADLPTLRIGVLKFGTVNWELHTIQSYGLDKAHGFRLEVVPFAAKQATATALHGKAVDVIVNDWIWVSRQRTMGRNYGFIPYSTINGGLVTHPDIQSLEDLKGQKIGVAGGPSDKSWLLFQAIAKKRDGFDLSEQVDIVFGAPPLISQKLESGELAGVINFWHYLAKLEAKGFNRLMDIKGVLSDFGLTSDIPMIGYVFSNEILQNQPQLVHALASASRAAKSRLQSDPKAWDQLADLMPVQNEKEFQFLKEGFLDGIPQKWNEDLQFKAAELYAILAKLGGHKLVGDSLILEPDTFVKSLHY